MTHDDITHLGNLSRIALTSAEVTDFTHEIDAILAYVSVVTTIAASGNSAKATPHVGVRYNVLRPDQITETAGSHTEALLAAMPALEGQYLSVKKILQQSQ